MEPTSRPVNLHRRVSTKIAPAVFDRLDAIQKVVEARKTRRARSEATQHRFRDCLRALCLDALEAHRTDPSLLIGIRRDKSALCKNPAYPDFVTARPFLGALDGLIEAEYLEQVEIGSQGSGRTSRIRSTPKLIQSLNIKGLDVGDILDASPLIIMSIGPKGSKKRKSFVETAETEQWRRNLERINQHNARYALTLNLENVDRQQLEDDRRKRTVANETIDDNTAAYQKVNFRNTRLHRVFNSADWTEGGRFYGAWWQSIPRGYRQHIQINGKPTCEYDYSGMHLKLIYQQAAAPLPLCSDPYSEPYGVEHRDVVKLAFNVMLNAKQKPRQATVPDFDEERMGMSWRVFLEGLVEHHSSIRKYFYSGFGKKLQRLDADIAEAVLLKFVGMQYPCLPIHDSFITYATLSDELPDYMQEVASDDALVDLLAKEVFTSDYSGPAGRSRESKAENIGTILDGLRASD